VTREPKTEAQFMGKITASATHEMRNVLAIIKESAGLIEDILEVSKDTSPATKEKFLRTLLKVRQQVERGVDLATRLNRFAHSPDEPVTGVDLNEIADQVASLTQRLAKLKRISLLAVRTEQPVIITGDSLKIQMLVYLCITTLLEVVEPGLTIGIGPRPAGDSLVALGFHLAGIDGSAEAAVTALDGTENWAALKEFAADLGVTLEVKLPPDLLEVVFATGPLHSGGHQAVQV
jgi:hypothetical protein